MNGDESTLRRGRIEASSENANKKRVSNRLTDHPGETATVLQAIADHKLVTAELTFNVLEQTTITRMV